MVLAASHTEAKNDEVLDARKRAMLQEAQDIDAAIPDLDDGQRPLIQSDRAVLAQGGPSRFDVEDGKLYVVFRIGASATSSRTGRTLRTDRSTSKSGTRRSSVTNSEVSSGVASIVA